MFQQKKKIRMMLQRAFGKAKEDYEIRASRKRMKLIRMYHEEMKDTAISGKVDETKGSDVCEVDEVTWSDLQMDEVFARVNHTKSYIGEQFLYHILHIPKAEYEQRMRNELQRTCLSENEQLRLELEEKLFAIGKDEGAYYLPYFLMHTELWRVKKTCFLYLLQILLVSLFLGTIITKSYVILMLLILSVGFNLMIYLRMKNQYEVFLYSLGTIKQMLNLGNFITRKEMREALQIPEEICAIVKELLPLSNQIMWWNTRKMMAFSGDISSIMQDYLCGITLLDITMFNHIIKQANGKQEALLKLFCYIGQMDVNIATVSYRGSLPFYCRASIKKENPFKVEEMVHPLLNNGVGNDFTLNKRGIITGGNAAGKSTFMKAVAINIIMAKALNTCTAKSFQIPNLSVMTSMSLRDDVLHGESFYFREAKRIKQMLDAAGQDKTYLFVIDEMLKGTNTCERVAAATSILQHFVSTNQYILVATHDFDVVNHLKGDYEDFYFDSIVKEKDIYFDYKIHAGKGGKTNAIALLKILDYPKEIIENARERIERNENW